MLAYYIIGILLLIVLLMLKLKSLPYYSRIVIFILLVAATVYLFSLFRNLMTLGATKWYNSEPYRTVVLYLVMLFGMVTSVLVKAVSDRKNRLMKIKDEAERTFVKLLLDRYDFFYPFLLSFLTFSALYPQVGEQKLSFIVLTLSYQTGFFWDSIFNDLLRKHKV